ncbi:hypothetical protein AAFF_G00078690 [Aldrovandia affinis]|uniref:Uncharacterized protein n=1 Tax=Aldrovandia affinis TaxID=143900 RepID=A0AAD7RX82_9TELE|nr:hypothetical protein AAFF_G00078690 [Aldrovandia affinis]
MMHEDGDGGSDALFTARSHSAAHYQRARRAHCDGRASECVAASRLERRARFVPFRERSLSILRREDRSTGPRPALGKRSKKTLVLRNASRMNSELGSPFPQPGVRRIDPDSARRPRAQRAEPTMHLTAAPYQIQLSAVRQRAGGGDRSSMGEAHCCQAGHATVYPPLPGFYDRCLSF